MDAKCSRSSGFSWNSEMTGSKCKYHQSPGSWKEKQPVGKICCWWSDPAALMPSNSMLSFTWNNKLFNEGRLVRSAVMVMGKSQPAAVGTDRAALADTSPGNNVHNVLRVVGRYICVSSEERLTVGFTATVRGRLEKEQPVSKTSAPNTNLPLHKPPNPVSYFILLAFELFRHRNLSLKLGQGYNRYRLCYSVLYLWEEPVKLQEHYRPQ